MEGVEGRRKRKNMREAVWQERGGAYFDYYHTTVN